MRRAGLVLLGLAAPASADPLQDRVLAGIRATRTADVAFTMTTRAERTGAATRTIVARFDPRTAWTLANVDGRAPTEKERRDAAKDKRRPPSYAKLADWFGSPAARIGQTPTSVTYRFSQLPAGSIKIGDKDVSAGAVAEAEVDLAHGAPHVARVRITSSRGFRMMLVAKVDRMSIANSYALMPDGRPFPTATEVDMAGSLFGKAGTVKTRTRYTDVRGTR